MSAATRIDLSANRRGNDIHACYELLRQLADLYLQAAQQGPEALRPLANGMALDIGLLFMIWDRMRHEDADRMDAAREAHVCAAADFAADRLSSFKAKASLIDAKSRWVHILSRCETRYLGLLMQLRCMGLDNYVELNAACASSQARLNSLRVLSNVGVGSSHELLRGQFANVV